MYCPILSYPILPPNLKTHTFPTRSLSLSLSVKVSLYLYTLLKLESHPFPCTLYLSHSSMEASPSHSSLSLSEQECNHCRYLDNIPDHLLLLIFNKVLDANSLTRCLAVSKRFASLVPLTDVVSLSILPPSPPPHNPKLLSRGFPVNFLKSLANKLLTRLRLRLRPVSPKPNRLAQTFSCHCPHRLLHNFSAITSLHLQLPSHGGAVASWPEDSHSFLKWKADFGADLKSCVILCATSFRLRNCDDRPPPKEHEQEPSDQPLLTSEELRSRILWTISCLIAASTRHFSVKQMVREFPKLRRLEITDSSKQGKLGMEEEEIVELRDSVEENMASSPLVERSVIPDLRMKMWYSKELELAESGMVMKGATLVVIRPCGKTKANGYGDFEFDVDEAEKAMVGEAVREIVKAKNYVMEMTSF